MGRIYLVRHGRTRWNKEKIFRGRARADVPLDAVGRAQALAVAGALGEKPQAVYSSPLARALETASIISREVGVCEPEPMEAFTDMDFGAWHGLSLDEARRDFPEMHRLWLEKPEDVRFPGGESLEEVLRRAWEGLTHVARVHSGESVLVVTHRVVNKTLILKALGAGLGAFWCIQQNVACLNILDFTGEGFIVRRVNDCCHLESLDIQACDF